MPHAARTRTARQVTSAAAVLAALALAGCEQRQPPAAAGEANAQPTQRAPATPATRNEQDFPSYQQRLAFLQQHVVVQVPHQARQIRFTHQRNSEGWSMTASFHLPPAAFEAFAKGLRRATGGRSEVFSRRDDRRGLAETLRLNASQHVVEIRSRSL